MNLACPMPQSLPFARTQQARGGREADRCTDTREEGLATLGPRKALASNDPRSEGVGDGLEDLP